MAEVKVLIKGYTTDESSGEKTCATTALIRDGDLTIITDPGVLEDQSILIDKLKAEGLSVDDIDIVFITHSHIDHYRNIGMFARAKTLEYYGLWDKNTVDDWQENFTKNIRIINTPGHSADSLTMLVKTDKGLVAICGDVFWKDKGPDSDEYATDKKELKVSRKKVLDLADYIIPGHGDVFEVSPHPPRLRRIESKK